MTEVRTASGVLRGEPLAGGVTVFRGVRYAAPPFGSSRFEPPVPPAPWRGVRDHVRFGPISPQSARLPGAPTWSPGDEDVLTLTVWAPRSGHPLPVLFWVHGGAFTFGSSAQPDFDGAHLARSGLVVVTVNHRLGFEGFGHVPGRPDNRGLLDLAAALGWVRDHVAAFGGDPERVTAAGQSSGASAVLCLAVMPAGRGLFRRIVAHSPVEAFFTVAEARSIAGELGTGTPAELVAASDRLVARYRADPRAGRPHHEQVLHAPVVDGDVLPAPVLESPVPQVELLLCSTTEESRLFHAVGSLPAVTEREVAEYAAVLGRDVPVRDTVLESYLALHDTRYAGYADALARWHGGAFAARFDRRRGGAVRAWHCADVPFAFGNLDAPGADFLIGGPPDQRDRELSGRMLRAWRDFATSGVPGWAAGSDHTWDVRPGRR
ncbi:carboxylesterase/lipase family protein [Umezawaea beigongshangensis]|uniref:carboxylesterase/lipase family protein n=1 Tax=Umezawaea beigongshangensis TaxID=2780383 RepID=UPI0018F17291|nr:carboxylesterase family protein [Umezawaea beigongshangensis]